MKTIANADALDAELKESLPPVLREFAVPQSRHSREKGAVEIIPAIWIPPLSDGQDYMDMERLSEYSSPIRTKTITLMSHRRKAVSA